MVDTNAASGLKWVKEEIVTSLQRVRGWLDEFAEADGAKPHLDAAVDTLSEVRSVLSALQLIGPARLAAEMQIQCEDLQAQFLPNPGEAAEALMLALIHLPHYLDGLEAGQEDVPLALLPSINDLRGSRGAASLTEAELLVPASVLAESEMPASDVQRSLGQIAGKIRPHFHLYMLQWLREDTSRLGLASLGRLFHRLQRHVGAGIFHELFLVAEAVVEALLEGSIAADARTKALVSHLDRVIKPFVTDPEAWPEADAQAQLFDLLSLIARCRSSSYRINELRSVYGLEQIAEGEETIPVELIAGLEPESPGLLVAEELAIHVDEPQALIEPVTPIDAELRDGFVNAAEPGHAPAEESTPGSDSGELEADASDEEAAEIAALAEADDELLDIFRSEAREQLEVLRAFVSRSGAEGDSAIPDEPVVRALHTLTGGARMTGLASTATVTEHLERLFQDHQERGGAPSEALLPLLGRTIDALEMRLTHLPGYGDEMAALRELSAALKEPVVLRESGEAAEDTVTGKEGPAPQPPDETASPFEIPTALVSEETIPPHDLRETPFLGPVVEQAGPAEDLADPGAPVEASLGAVPRSEQINKAEQRADLHSVDELAQQGGLTSFRLGELDRTLDRLRDQLRQLEIETETQILHCHERDADNLVPGHHGSDPIEPDRFSTLQQLARSLAETVNDLGSLRTLLQDVQEESDTPLQQQARIADDLPADDGAGLDLEAIKQRAVDLGLVAESADPGDEEVTGLILRAGVSTAPELSQIAGRAPGQEVVNTEVKQLSGSLGVETQPGRGTDFTIRVPLSRDSVQALLVQIGEQVFAVPQASVEATSRIAQSRLEACYQGQAEGFSHAGHDYRVVYLGSLLQLAGRPNLGERRWLPVLLAHSGDQRIAFHVDQMLGTQRVVVKPLGPELRSLPWLSGGTILPDGRVALVLDLLTLAEASP